MITRGTKEKLRRQLLRQINRKIRALEVRIFTNEQATPKTDNVFWSAFDDNFDTLSELLSTGKQRNEVNHVIHRCNQHIIKLRLIKRLLNIHNVLCVFKCLADDKYQRISLNELNELLGKSKVSCEKEQPKIISRLVQ